MPGSRGCSRGRHGDRTEATASKPVRARAPAGLWGRAGRGPRHWEAKGVAAACRRRRPAGCRRPRQGAGASAPGAGAAAAAARAVKDRESSFGPKSPRHPAAVGRFGGAWCGSHKGLRRSGPGTPEPPDSGLGGRSSESWGCEATCGGGRAGEGCALTAGWTPSPLLRPQPPASRDPGLAFRVWVRAPRVTVLHPAPLLPTAPPVSQLT